MSIVLSILSMFATSFGISSKPFAVDLCPQATASCQETENENEFKCVAFANQPSNEDIPQYAWQVSVGKIVGDPKVHRIMIDARHVEAKSLVVTVKVRWPKSPRACEATVENTISLR
jgi:hypothetical protein